MYAAHLMDHLEVRMHEHVSDNILSEPVKQLASKWSCTVGTEHSLTNDTC